MSDRVRGGWAAGYLIACILLGGASNGGVFANAALQIVAVLLILAVLWTSPEPVLSSEARMPAWVAGMFAAFVLLSLLPLPPGLWTSLPGREPVARGYDLLGMGIPSIPLSLSPSASVSSALALLPPAAIFLLVCNLSSTWRKRLCWILLLAAAASIFLSAFQLFGGERSPLRFYQVTNPNRPVGFFASANHLPTLVLCALPFLGWLAADAMSSSRAQKRSSGLTMALSLAGFLVAGILASGSMAGYALLVPAALATFLIYRRAVAKRVGLPWAILVGLLSVGFIVAAASAPLGQRVVNDKFSEHPTSRGVIWQNTAEAVRAFAPMGSGLGTFVPVYRTFDNPDRASRVYVNHAHNDYLEFLLELGAAGAMLVLAFLFWWARKGVRAWADEYQGAGMARIGSIVTGLILLHSTVDYPLRTAAMAAVFALAAGLMVPPPASARHRRTSKEQELTGGLRHVGID